MYRKGSYIVGRIAGLIAVLLLGSLVAVQTPFVQTKLTQKALEHLVPAMQGRIGYDELRILPSGVLLLKNAVIVDSNPYTEDIHGRGWEKVDTLFRARTITATFRLASIFGGGSVLIDRVDVSDAMMHLAVEPGEVTNLERIFGLEQTDETPEPGPEIFSIRKVRISNFRFRLNNFCEATAEWPGYGINYDDIDLTTDMNGHSLRFAGGRMYGVADKVTLTEKSGYRLLRASGRCVAGQGKTLVENCRLTDPWSQLNVKSFSMTYENSASFEDFITKVLMECELRPSMIGIPTLKVQCVPVLLYHDELPEDALLCPMIDARRMEVYAAIYDRALKTVRDISADIIDETSYTEFLDKQPVYFFGDGAAKCKTKITHPNARFIDDIRPLASMMCPLAEKAIAENDFKDVAYFEPFYLKEFVASKPKKLL